MDEETDEWTIGDRSQRRERQRGRWVTENRQGGGSWLVGTLLRGLDVPGGQLLPRLPGAGVLLLPRTVCGSGEDRGARTPLRRPPHPLWVCLPSPAPRAFLPPPPPLEAALGTQALLVQQRGPGEPRAHAGIPEGLLLGGQARRCL